MALTTIGVVHTAAASVSLLAGAFQLGRRRRDLLHRRVGYCYAAAMVMTNVSALLVYRFNGRFNVFHVLALVALVTLAMALRPMLMRPRPQAWRVIHYYWVCWSYTGLCAAAATEFLLRVVHVPGLASAAIGTPIVIAVGAWLINRNAPPAPRATAHEARSG